MNSMAQLHEKYERWRIVAFFRVPYFLYLPMVAIAARAMRSYSPTQPGGTLNWVCSGGILFMILVYTKVIGYRLLSKTDGFLSGNERAKAQTEFAREDYDAQHYYWFLVEVAFKGSLVLTRVLFLFEVTLCLAVMLVLFSAWGLSHRRHQPYLLESVNTLKTVALGSQWVFVLVALVYHHIHAADAVVALVLIVCVYVSLALTICFQLRKAWGQASRKAVHPQMEELAAAEEKEEEEEEGEEEEEEEEEAAVVASEADSSTKEAEPLRPNGAPDIRSVFQKEALRRKEDQAEIVKKNTETGPPVSWRTQVPPPRQEEEEVDLT